MKANKYREAIAAGRIPIGHMVWEFGTRGIAKILESMDLDFVLFDMEHSGFGIERICDLIAWSKAARFAPFVRVPQLQYNFMARVMDAGALGVMAPNVQTPEEAQLVVDSMKYAPLGRRGVGLNTAHTDYLGPNPPEYFAESNANSVVICQIESPLGVENVERIAATKGVDNLWVGHFDLTQAMGIPGQFQHPQFLDALKRVADTAKKHGLRAGIQPTNMDQAQQWMALGYNCISWGSDSIIYRNALDAAVRNLREHMGKV